MRFLIPLLFGATTFCSCVERKQSVSFINYNSAMDSIQNLYSIEKSGQFPLDLRRLFNKSDWDSIVFMLPYLPKEKLTKLDFCNTRYIQDTMEYVIGVEWNQGLLFLKKNCITAYSVIGGNISFFEIARTSNASVPVIGKSSTKMTLLVVTSSNDAKSFFIVPVNYSEKEKFGKRNLDSVKISIPLDSLLQQ